MKKNLSNAIKASAIIEKNNYKVHFIEECGIEDIEKRYSYSYSGEKSILIFLRERNYIANGIINQKSKVVQKLQEFIKENQVAFMKISFYIFHKTEYVSFLDLRSDFREEQQIRLIVQYKNNVRCFDWMLQSVFEQSFLEECKEHINTFRSEQELPVMILERRRYDLKCCPGVGGYVFHEIYGHMLEEDFIENKNSILFNKFSIGEQITNEAITYVDAMNDEDKKIIGLNKIDDKGNLLKRVELIRNGILKNKIKMLDGFARREGYKKRAIPRMRCTYIENNTEWKRESCSNRIIILTDAFSGFVNPLTGEIFVWGRGILYEDGEKKAQIANVSINDDFFSFIQSVAGVGNDLKKKKAYCKKQEQTVPVIVGSPTIYFKNIMLGVKN